MDRKNKFGNMFLKFIGNKIKFQEDFPKRQCKSTQNAPVSGSAIGQHLLDNKICSEKFDTNWFSILATGRSSFDLLTLEATFIESFKPSLCRQKGFVYELCLLCLIIKQRLNTKFMHYIC